jgi:hypothetical protein
MIITSLILCTYDAELSAVSVLEENLTNQWNLDMYNITPISPSSNALPFHRQGSDEHTMFIKLLHPKSPSLWNVMYMK